MPWSLRNIIVKEVMPGQLLRLYVQARVQARVPVQAQVPVPVRVRVRVRVTVLNVVSQVRNGVSKLTSGDFPAKFWLGLLNGTNDSTAEVLLQKSDHSLRGF